MKQGNAGKRISAWKTSCWCVFRTCIFWQFQIQPDKCSVLPNSKYAHKPGSGRQGKRKGISSLVSTTLQQHWILYYCKPTVQYGSHPKHHAGEFFVLSIQKENKNVIVLGRKLDINELLMLNMNIFLKLCLLGIHNTMAIGKDLISLTSWWSNFYTARIEHNWLQKNTNLWSISMDLNRVSFISKEYKVKRVL